MSDLLAAFERSSVCPSLDEVAFHLKDQVRAAALDAGARARVDEIVVRLAQLTEAFAHHVVAATGDWTKHIPDEAALQSLPEFAKRRARAGAQARQLEGFLLTLDASSYQALLHHSDDRKLRHDVYEAYVTRASDHGPRAGRFDNTPLVHETLALRHELALLLGFENYAELALRHSVLQSPDDVEHYLLRSGGSARARAQAELDAVWAFAKAQESPRGSRAGTSATMRSGSGGSSWRSTKMTCASTFRCPMCWRVCSR